MVRIPLAVGQREPIWTQLKTELGEADALLLLDWEHTTWFKPLNFFHCQIRIVASKKPSIILPPTYVCWVRLPSTKLMYNLFQIHRPGCSKYLLLTLLSPRAEKLCESCLCVFFMGPPNTWHFLGSQLIFAEWINEWGSEISTYWGNRTHAKPFENTKDQRIWMPTPASGPGPALTSSLS